MFCSSPLALLNYEVLGHRQRKGRGRAVVVRQQSVARPARKSNSAEDEEVSIKGDSRDTQGHGTPLW